MFIVHCNNALCSNLLYLCLFYLKKTTVVMRGVWKIGFSNLKRFEYAKRRRIEAL